MNPKIIFYYLPPANIGLPAPAFSVLKSFLLQHGFEADICYFNILADQIISPYIDDYIYHGKQELDINILQLLPFLSMIAHQQKDKAAQERTQYCLNSFLPGFTSIHESFSSFLETITGKINQLMETCLEEINPKDTLLIGFSSKFQQWLPGKILAEKIKSRFPGLKTVIGGFGNKREAESLLNKCKNFDLAIWGEGEFPMLELCKSLANEDTGFDTIPRLIYRDGHTLKFTRSSSSYSEFDNYVYPDISDFIGIMKKSGIETKSLTLFIENSRGCCWNRCKFCSLNQGYKVRSRPVADLLKEIKTRYETYGVTQYTFLGNDIVGPDIQQFEQLLDGVINLSKDKNEDFEFDGEMIHKDLSKDIVRKMALAGFKNFQIGYEAVSDGLLKKMSKSTDFANHILYIKFALKNGINPVAANIMRGISDEEREDVFESINNLPFLRFFLGRKKNFFKHRLRQFHMMNGSRYFLETDKKQLLQWNQNEIFELLPDSFLNENDKFNLFSFKSHLKYENEWLWFENVNQYYEQADYYYRIISQSHIHYYYEYLNGRQIARIIFDEPGYWDVLVLANEKIMSFADIFNRVQEAHPHISEKRLREIVVDLKSSHLLYANQEYSRIVSVIDTNLTEW